MTTKCYDCGEPIPNEDEILWVEEVTGLATTTFGQPYHPACAPEERCDGDFERLAEFVRRVDAGLESRNEDGWLVQ